MLTTVRWGAGVEECKLHLWEFWKKCVSLKRASAQHTQKIDSLPSSSLSELPPGLSQEILLKGSLFVHLFYTKNAFVYIFNIWKQFSKIYREFSGSCSLDLQCLKLVSSAAAVHLENGLNECMNSAARVTPGHWSFPGLWGSSTESVLWSDNTRVSLLQKK